MSREELKQKYFPLLPESTVIPLSVSTILDMLMVATQDKPSEVDADTRLDAPIYETLKKRNCKHIKFICVNLQQKNIYTLRDALNAGRYNILKIRNCGKVFITHLQDLFQELGYDF